MNNPWKEVQLSDYESHMALSDVYQLQTLDHIMGAQFESYRVESVAILGVAGGNGLANLIDLPSIHTIYGVDINPDYLRATEDRYPLLAGRYTSVLADINDDSVCLPHAELVVANLFIEYVGCRNFSRAIHRMCPNYVSCVIQIDPADSFVSDSPYAVRLGVLDAVHASVDATELIEAMRRIGYSLIYDTSTTLPNGKIFRRLDFGIVRSL